MFKIQEMKSRQEIDDLFEKNKTELTVSKEKLFDYSRANTYRDVHVYDNQGETIIFPNYSQEEKVNAAKHLQSLLRNGMAVHMINIMLSRNNYDQLNKIDSLDMLRWIHIHPITPELFYLLEEQLADNGTLGTCLQGSSWRLRQVLYAQMDLNV